MDKRVLGVALKILAQYTLDSGGGMKANVEYGGKIFSLSMNVKEKKDGSTERK